ncbi:MAG: PHP domain-containing protein [Deltaproteobacteria bacterium]|nr:MAG: PHP domain-containing protein [Deltaproteobacteria bacterium]
MPDFWGWGAPGVARSPHRASRAGACGPVPLTLRGDASTTPFRAQARWIRPGGHSRVSPSMAAEFVHLHVHSEFSMLDGAIRIPQLVEHVAKMGMPAVALTDNGNMFGAVQLVRTCAGTDVKPILGCEVNFTAGDRRDPQNRELHHLLLLASSQEGYQNLVRLVSAGWVDGMAADDEPRIDFEVLRNHSAGVVGLSACMGGYVAQEILNKGPDVGRDAIAIRPGPFLRRASGPWLPREPAAQPSLGPTRQRARASAGRDERLSLPRTPIRACPARAAVHRRRAKRP